MSEEDLIKAGIAAAKAGDMANANAIFARVVKEFPMSERGWYFLGMTCSAPNQREYCMKRVLTLNPNNAEAKKQLGGISTPPAPKPPAAQPVIQAEKQAAPKIETEKISAPKETKPEKKKAKKKSANWILISAVVGAFVLICSATGVVYMLFLRPAQTTSAPAPQPVTISTETITPPVVDTPTFTLEPPTAIPSPLPTVSYSPYTNTATCSFEVPQDAKVNCGYVVVPEDRTGDPNHTIKLAYAVFHSTNETPAEPVVFLQGGPGAGAIQLSAEAYPYLVQPFLAEHDFVVFDQRGTGLSEPALICDELTKAYSQDIHGLLPAETRELVYSNAFISCNGLMSVKGVKLNAYTTAASAADLKDVITVLGYQKANLYGASYGTRLALVTMREYPEIVKSAILDSVVPVEANIFLEYPQAVDSALSALFDGCAASPECNAAYPNLETVFWDLTNELDKNPVTVSSTAYPVGRITETVNGSTLMSIVLGSIKSSSLIHTAPQTIYRIKNGDYSTLIAAQYAMPFAFEGINPGLYISMMCHEHIFATTADDLQAIVSRNDIKEHSWLPFYGDANDIYNTCKRWGSIQPAYGENDAVSSDIPALIITGTYDPSTPPFYGEQIAGKLSHSYYFEFPNQGHTPTAADITGCAMNTAVNFLKTPEVEPDRACLNELSQVAFLTPYAGDAKIEFESKRAGSVELKAPKGWFDFGDGFFLRASSLLDITQIGVAQVNVSISELKDWLSLSAYGYRGLDTAPINAGQHNETWTLYTSTSNSRPVDIAMTKYGKNSLVVIMFSHKDERDALYKNIFLPMLDSVK